MRSCLVALLLLATASPAIASPLALTAASHGSALDLSFENHAGTKLTLETHVRAGIDHYDWLTVELTANKVHRTLHFIETRTRASPVSETIAPGGVLTKSIDLAFWAVREGNGGPLAPGTYEVDVRWDTGTHGCGGLCPTLVAKTRLTIVAPIEKPCTESPASHSGLELLVHQDGGVLEVGVHNVDPRAHCVAGYIKTHETQSDWLTVTLDGKRTLHFDDSRDKSVAVHLELAPGATAWTRWDLGAWARRSRNGGAPLVPGARSSTVTYDATRETGAWNGKLVASLGIRVP